MNTTTTKQSQTMPKLNANAKNKVNNKTNSGHSNATYSKQFNTGPKSTDKNFSSNHSLTRSVENFVIIWLDSNLNESDDNYQKTISSLQRIVNGIKTFTNIKSCVAFLSQIENEKVFIIVSGSLGQTIMPHIHCMSNVNSIYIFCSNRSKHELWTKEWIKVKGVFTQITPICHSLKQDIQQCENSLMPISILPTTNLSKQQLNELDRSFMYSQLLKEILLELKYTADVKKDLVDFCRIQYCGNTVELQVIDEFEKDYEHHSPIWWYTRECFTYLMLNKALRTQDIEVILKMGFFIRDLHVQIEQLHSMCYKQNQLTVYRGQGMFDSELQNIFKSKGGLLSFNNFLSTSVDRRISLEFAKAAKHIPDMSGILFQMEIDPTVKSACFAQLDDLSYYSDLEKEVLFSMHTVFRIDRIERIEARLWQVKLTLTDDNDIHLNHLTELIRQEIGPGTGWHRLSQLMIKMGKFDKAKEISEALLDSVSSDDARTKATCHHQLGCVHDEKGDLTSALIHYKQSLDISLAFLPPDDPSLASTYSNIGSIYKKQGDLSAALEFFQRALHIDLHASHSDRLRVASHYNNIGLVFKEQDKYDEALQHYERALEMKLAHLPLRHPSLAITYTNISGVYQSRKEYAQALSFLEKTLEIKQKSLPPQHPSLIVTHRNMALAFDGLRRYKEAVQHAQLSVDIARSAFEIDHPEVKENQEYLDELLQKL